MTTNHWVSHLYQREDREAILGIIRARPAARLGHFPTLADMQEMLAVDDIARLTSVWETETGDCVGYACLSAGDDYASLIFEYLPAYSATDLGGQMIAWSEQAYRERYHGKAEDLMSTALESDAERIHLLEQHGFTRDSDCVLHMDRDLRQPIPTPRLPDGFAIRCLAGPQETEAWVALHRAAFGTQNMTVEYRVAMFQTPGYNPSLDLVAVAPDGSLAAYVVCAIHSEENALSGLKIGWTDPVATHPTYQRLGLSRELLLAGLNLLRERGMDTARLGTSSDNRAMQKAAESAGFRVSGRALSFTKVMKLKL